MAETAEIKKGAVIRHSNHLYVVKDFKFVNPGKGVAFTKTKMKDIAAGKTIEITYKSGENVDIVEVYKKTMQYLGFRISINQLLLLFKIFKYQFYII